MEKSPTSREIPAPNVHVFILALTDNANASSLDEHSRGSTAKPQILDAFLYKFSQYFKTAIHLLLKVKVTFIHCTG